MNPIVLLTGFDPFGGEAVNPSWEAVQMLNGLTLAGHTIVARQLPTIFGESLLKLNHLIDEHDPALVLCVGQASGRAELSLERVALNLDDARIPDNRGNQPVDKPVFADGPTAYLSNLPLKAMLRALHTAGIPAAVSQTAGTFVCNHVFYGLMHRLHEDQRQRRGGFIHIPYAPEQAVRHRGEPFMTKAFVVAGLQVAIETALTTDTDIRLAAGAES